MIEFIVGIFVVVYLGMILGGLPLVQLERTGVALLGAIALIVIGFDAVSLEEAAQSIHLPTLILLFAFMVVSAQMRLGGFYDGVTRWLTHLPLAPSLLLGTLIFVVAALSAVFSNDIVCLAVAPVLIDACRGRGLDPRPFLLALACGANNRFSRDPDRKPAEHVDRLDTASVVRRLPARGSTTGRAGSGRDLGADGGARASPARERGRHRIARWRPSRRNA